MKPAQSSRCVARWQAVQAKQADMLALESGRTTQPRRSALGVRNRVDVYRIVEGRAREPATLPAGAIACDTVRNTRVQAASTGSAAAPRAGHIREPAYLRKPTTKTAPETATTTLRSSKELCVAFPLLLGLTGSGNQNAKDYYGLGGAGASRFAHSCLVAFL